MFTEIGRRVPLHATGVGKALLAAMAPDAADALVARTGMSARTPATLTDPAALREELAAARRRGWVLDEGEQEVGVRCVAAPVPGAPTPCAVSVSGPAERVSPAGAERAGPAVVAAAARLGLELAGLPDDDPSEGALRSDRSSDGALRSDRGAR
jgi:IclR family transcriptional regulator, acetate operon repressor